MTKTTIAVLGAAGKSGRAFVDAALKAGYSVRAGVRHNSLSPSPNLEVIHCDATNITEVRELLQGCTIVVSLIGHVSGSEPNMQTKAMKVLVELMQELGIRRLISLTGTGVRQASDKPSLIDIIANKAIALLDPDRIQDGINHAAVIANSPLDWTIVRVLKLTSGNEGQFSLSAHGPAKPFTSRKEVARAILQVIETDEWIRAYPVITHKS